MALPNGDVLHDMRAAQNPSPYTDYDVDIKENFDKVETNFTLLNNKVSALAQADIGLAADAVNNVLNLLVNGDFRMSFCAPLEEDASTGPVVPTANGSGIKLVRWADAWFVEEDTVDALDVQSVDIDNPPSGGQWFDPQGGLKLLRGSGSGTHTGRVFQRIDLHADLVNLRGKSLTVGVAYTAVTDDEFYVEIDDGVSPSDNSAAVGGPSPAGTGVSRHTHVVASNATKLTLSIVLQVEAPVVDADALLITQAYARVGVSPVTIPVGVPPAQTARDMVLSQMYSRYFVWATAGNPVTFPSSVSFSNDQEDYSEYVTLPVPLLNLDVNTIVGDFFVDGVGDARDILSLPSGQQPVLSLHQQARTMMNRAAGDTKAGSGFFTGAKLELTRTPLIAAASGQPMGDFGFTATELGVAVAVIPDP